MARQVLSLIFLGLLIMGHIGFAMEPMLLQHNKQQENNRLQKKIAEFDVLCPVTHDALLPEIQLHIASYMISDFLSDTAMQVRENLELGDSSYGKLQLAEMSHNDKWLITVHEASDTSAHIWCMETAQLKHVLNNYESSIYSVTISPNDEYVLTGCEDGMVHIWNMITGTLERTLSIPVNPINSTLLHWINVYSDNTHVVSASLTENSVQIWSMETGDVVSSIKSTRDHCIGSLIIVPESGQLVTASCNFSLRLWDMVKGKLLRVLAEEPVMAICHDIVLTADNKYLIAARKTKVSMWDMQTGQEYIFKVYNAYVKSLRLSLDKTKLIIMTSDGLVEVLDIKGRLLYSCPFGRINCPSLLFAFDGYGKKCLKSSFDKSVNVHDIETGLMLYTLQGHEKDINLLKTNSDGTQVVTGSFDNTIRIWSLKKSSARLWLENQILPFQANLIARVYAANKLKQTFEIASGTDDMFIWVSLPSHVRDYLNLYLQVVLVPLLEQIHQ